MTCLKLLGMLSVLPEMSTTRTPTKLMTKGAVIAPTRAIVLTKPKPRLLGRQ